MAIAFDAAANGRVTDTSLTFAHTCTGTDLILFVGVGIRNQSNDIVSSITYNGVSMTRVPTNGYVAETTGNDSAYLYYLINPATGANNVVITISESQDMMGVSTSYTGARQSSQPDASNKSTSAGTDTITTSITPVASNCWAVTVEVNDADFPAGGTNVTERTQNSVTGIGDTHGIIS